MAFKEGDKVFISVDITEKMVADFAAVSGDFNPIHMDDEFAKKTRFGRRIAHGMLSGALISRALAMNLENGGIYLSQTLKFLAPIYIGDKITIELRVNSIRESGVAAVETTVTNQKEEVCVKGTAMIMRPENRD